jgi:hypothetical protein
MSAAGDLRLKDLGEVLVNRAIVVDDDDPSTRAVQGIHLADSDGWVWARMIELRLARRRLGKTRVKVAPHPSPSLVALSEPPSSIAEHALECSPKPWPWGFVVKPWLKILSSVSLAMPSPSSEMEIAISSSGSPRVESLMV